MEAVGRRNIRYRLHKCQQNYAVQYPRHDVGRRSDRYVRRPRKHVPRSVSVGSRVRLYKRGRRRGEDTCMRRRGRSASGALRTPVHKKRQYKEYVRHGLFRTYEYGRRADRIKARTGHYRCREQGRAETSVRSRRQRIRRRRRYTMAEGRTGAYKVVSRNRRNSDERKGYGRSLHSARVRRTGRSALGSEGERAHHGHNARHVQGAYRARGSRIHSLPGGRRHARDEERRGV